MITSNIEGLRACAASGDRHWIVEALINPITGTLVMLDPPCTFDLSSAATAEREYLGLIRRFEEYCRAAWDLALIAPDRITAKAGWLPARRQTVPIRPRTPEQRRAYLAGKRAELAVAGKDTAILDIVEELMADE